MSRHTDELYGDRLTHIDPYSVLDVLVEPVGRFDIHHDRVKRLDGVASRRTTAEFIKRFAYPGVYGLTDPIADHVVYVGRSANIGQRFRSHVSGDGDTYFGTLRSKKREWLFDLKYYEGRKPGLIVLSRINTAEEEMRFIQAIKPLYNTVQRMKPLTLAQKTRADRRAVEDLERAEEKKLEAEEVALGNIAIRAARRERKGLQLTEYEVECCVRYDKMVVDRDQRNAERAKLSGSFYRVRR